MPQISLRVPRYDLDCRAELLPDLAPATVSDRGSIPYGVTRPEIGNLVGSSVGDFSAFAEACWRLAFEGWKTLHVERAE
jgi:hypothetical protein